MIPLDDLVDSANYADRFGRQTESAPEKQKARKLTLTG